MFDFSVAETSLCNDNQIVLPFELWKELWKINVCFPLIKDAPVYLLLKEVKKEQLSLLFRESH